jgi:hypothetical protein
MRVLAVAGLGLLLAGCNQVAQTGSPVAQSASDTAVASNAAQTEAPIYEPLVDMHRVNVVKYQRDLAECRQQAAPQEVAARAAKQQQAAGTALAVAGVAASFIPVSGFRQARQLAHATNNAVDTGGAIAENGAVAAGDATADYALVVNTCLSHKKYRLLRA